MKKQIHMPGYVAKIDKTKRKKVVRIFFIAMILLLLTFLVSLNMGIIKISPIEVFQTLVGMGTDKQKLVLFDFRLPRLVLAVLIGAGLSVSGAIMQGVTRNPLADPGILGVNTGAGLFVAFYIMYAQGKDLGLLNMMGLPVVAMAGGMLTAILIYVFSVKSGKVSPVRMILVGIGVGMLMNAVLFLVQLKMDPRKYMSLTVWLSGSIWGSNWKFVISILPWMLLIPYAVSKSSVLNIMNMGEDVAIGLGVNVEKQRLVLAFISVALSASCVAAGGNISFVGLIAPHLARRIVGPKHEYLIPISAIMGSLLVLVADLFARQLLSPREIPTGIAVAVIGAPYFLYLLRKSKA